MPLMITGKQLVSLNRCSRKGRSNCLCAVRSSDFRGTAKLGRLWQHSAICQLVWETPLHFVFFFVCLFWLFAFSRAPPAAYGGSQARGLIGAPTLGPRLVGASCPSFCSHVSPHVERSPQARGMSPPKAHIPLFRPLH